MRIVTVGKLTNRLFRFRGDIDIIDNHFFFQINNNPINIKHLNQGKTILPLSCCKMSAIISFDARNMARI